MAEKRIVEPKKRRRSAPKLHAAAENARREALEHLGEAAASFTAAITRYVNAVEAADEARREWERLGRPMMHRFANGMEGIHPLVSTMERMDKAAAGFGAALGLDPMSRKRLHGPGHGGRPAGANSAPDRTAPWVPRPLLRDGEPPRISVVADLPPIKRKREAPVLTPGRLAKQPPQGA